MKILILGASGLLGNTFLEFYKKKKLSKKLKLYFTLRKRKKNYIYFDVDKEQSYKNIQKLNPDIVVNCIGAIKPFIKEEIPGTIINAIKLNSIFPKDLVKIFPKSKIIHFNTDCVYSGKSGNYSEKDKHDYNDIYGMTKSLGEIKSKKVMNLRCSIIGIEVNSSLSLLSWFLKNKKKILSGFTNHKWNGLSTIALVKITHSIIVNKLFKPGVVHLVPKDKISKYNLLKLLNKKYFNGKKTIKPIKQPVSVNRTLTTINMSFNKKLWVSSDYGSIKSISQMIDEI